MTTHDDRIDTYAPETAAVHLTLKRESTGTYDEMTLIWHTGRTHCEPFDWHHGSTSWPDAPAMWDASGCGDWEVVDTVQCPQCGSRYGTHSRLLEGHAGDRTIQDAATIIREDVEADRDRLRAEKQVSLAEDLEYAIKYDDFKLDPRAPGVYRDDDGDIVAWCFDPWVEGKTLEVRP